MISRILIVGHGSIGKRHAELGKKLNPHAEIRVVRELEENSLFNPQVAVVANPASCHLTTALELAKKGVHLLIEKPLSVSCEGVQELIDICRSQKIALLIGYNLRFSPSLLKLKSCIEQKLVGSIFSVRCEVGQYLPSWRPGTDYTKSVSAQRELGGGVLLELSHEIDYLCWLFGEISWVQAVISKQSQLEINVEDTAHIVFCFEQGLLIRLDMDFIRHDSMRQCVLIGEQGSLRWDALLGQIELHKANSKQWEKIFSQSPESDETYLAEWRNLIACSEGEADPVVTVQESLNVLRVIQSIRESAQLGSRVYL